MTEDLYIQAHKLQKVIDEQEAVIITEELKSFISEKIDDVTQYNCDRCMEDCDECGLMDTMHNLKIALGIEKED